MMYQYIFCFKYFMSSRCFYFLWMFMLCKKEATTFHIYSNKILHIFEEFNNDLNLWKSKVTTIKKGKIFNISLTFSKYFSYWSLYLLAQYIICKSHDFLISCFESGHISLKRWLFGKIHFVILFWTRSMANVMSLFPVHEINFSKISNMQNYLVEKWI